MTISDPLSQKTNVQAQNCIEHDQICDINDLKHGSTADNVLVSSVVKYFWIDARMVFSVKSVFTVFSGMSLTVSTSDIIVNEVPKVERIGAHSHIYGLGLDDSLNAATDNQGMVGQIKARRAAGLIVKMIKDGKIAGRAILITGEPGTGKTALAMGISKAISAQTPFVSMTASEVYSVDMSKTEILTQAIRKAIGVTIAEKKTVISGEVVSVETERPQNGIGKRTGKITLKTTDMEAVFDIGSKMIETVIRDRISAGDVIRIDKTNGTIERLGRSALRNRGFDAVSNSVSEVPCPDGELEKHVELVDTVALHEIDAINSRAQGYLTVFSGDTGEIKSEIREAVDKKINEWREQERARIVPGVLFIDEVHVLDLECFAFLNRAMEGEFAPIIVMATNRGMTQIRGTSFVSAHGVPVDLLDRALIVKTVPYSEEEVKQILIIRARAENVTLSPGALLITVSDILRQRAKAAEIQPEHVKKAYSMFHDVHRVKKLLEDNGEQYITYT
uniref:RuvB-like helicase n=1 Tax=Panagrellus redivivus TaxID=6233 RepID=A0A7E4V1Y4_PANRE